MALEIFNWLKDFSGYLNLGFKRAVVPRMKKGVDYTEPKYKDQVRQVVENIHPKQMKLRVSKVIKETTTTKTFRFERLDAPLPPFRAGQYVNLFVEIKGVRTSRPYSISSVPGGDLLDLTVRKKPGGFISPFLLSKLKKSDELTSTGPLGHFYPEPLIDGADLVFIAGGSGITPFMSMLREQLTKGWPQKITLLYGARTPKDVVFGKELKAMARQSERFNYTLVISEPPKGYKGETGFLDSKIMKKLIGEVEKKTFFICGPNVMYDYCIPELKKLKVPVHKIRRELYGPPDPVTEQPGWPKKIKAKDQFKVEVAGRKSFSAPAGEPLINSLERNHLVIPAECRSGECSACRIKLIRGKVFMPENVGLRESDHHTGHIHACVSYPLTDIEIRLEG